MRITSSLTNRIFIASTLLSTLSLGLAFVFANARASQEVEADLDRGLTDAAAMVDQHRATKTETMTEMARLNGRKNVRRGPARSAHRPCCRSGWPSPDRRSV